MESEAAERVEKAEREAAERVEKAEREAAERVEKAEREACNLSDENDQNDQRRIEMDFRFRCCNRIQALIDSLEGDKECYEYLLSRKRAFWISRRLRPKLWPKKADPVKTNHANMLGMLKEMLKDEDNVPVELCCPITMEVMRDPVCTADGHTYESKAIESWLKHKNTSPFTNRVLQSRQLIKNHALRKILAYWNIST